MRYSGCRIWRGVVSVVVADVVMGWLVAGLVSMIESVGEPGCKTDGEYGRKCGDCGLGCDECGHEGQRVRLVTWKVWRVLPGVCYECDRFLARVIR